MAMERSALRNVEAAPGREAASATDLGNQLDNTSITRPMSKVKGCAAAALSRRPTLALDLLDSFLHVRDFGIRWTTLERWALRLIGHRLNRLVDDVERCYGRGGR